MKTDKDPLIDLYNIEDIQTMLNDEEIRLINTVFNDIEEVNQITDTIENALSNNRTNYQQLNKIFKTITKIAYYNTTLKVRTQPKKSIFRTFFELPEIISKKIHLYLYRSKI